MRADEQRPPSLEKAPSQRFLDPRRRVLAALLAVAWVVGSVREARPVQNPDPAGRGAPVTVAVEWDRVVAVSRTSASLQVVVNPLLRRESPVHRRAFRALRDLGADQVRFVAWLPYPRLAVAELSPPEHARTSWDFSLIDPLVVDFMAAMQGRTVMMNFSTIPQWMFVTEKRVPYPADPDAITWDYTQGTELRDPSFRELAAYYARLVSWYTRGGFVDEAGVRRTSPYRYRFDYWEVFNEPNGEHRTTAEQYTARYDAIVTAIRAVAPEIKFAGPALAFPLQFVPFFKHFLDPKNHRPGVPLDVLTYHFYALGRFDEVRDACPSPMFEQTDRFVHGVRRIETVRERLRPGLPTAINEIGALDSDEFLHQFTPGFVGKPIPPVWWNASAAVFAHQFGLLARSGIEVVGQSALAQYPGQFPSTSMLDWTTGRPNARYLVLKLLREWFRSGDQMPATAASVPMVYAQAFASPDRGRRLLLVNTCDRPFEVTIPDGAGAGVIVVDQRTRSTMSAGETVDPDGILRLGGYAVAVVSLPAAVVHADTGAPNHDGSAPASTLHHVSSPIEMR